MIEATPAVKSQSSCPAPGISTGPRSVVQVPMADGESTGLGEVSVSVSSETLRIQQDKSAKFGYLSMMVVTTLGSLNTESFCECVLSCVKLVVSDLHVSLKAEEIRMLVMLRMNREFMEYMRASYPDTPLSDFKSVDTYVRTQGGVEALDDDEDDE